jgi:hypothetical protein
VVEQTRNVNASCVSGNVVASVVKRNPSCFAACPRGPSQESSPCWIGCLFGTLVRMPKAQIVAPFEQSFASADPAQGGCPEVPPCPPPCKPQLGLR